MTIQIFLKKEVYLRNLVFGVEDGLVSTVGLLSGIASANASKTSIVLSGVILILVEAMSMAAGSFSSEESVSDRSNYKLALMGALIMFSAYVLAGLIPLSPYLIFATNDYAISVVLSLISLFFLGYFSARVKKRNQFFHGIHTFFVGGSVILVATIIGNFFNIH